MRILVLGGTLFYGRHFTELALAMGHSVTLFTRGLHNADLFEKAERRQGDRDGGLAALADGHWDVVLDTCGYVPRVVRESAALLKDRVGVYAFVSSISVYSDEATEPITEATPVGVLEDPTTEVVDGATYGPLKAACEAVVRDVYGDRALIIRPGLIVGPYDSSDRFTYWPWRLAKGGDVVVPDRPDQAVQIIDARDLAEWTLLALERRLTGTFHATGPSNPYHLQEMLERIDIAVGGRSEFVAVPLETLAEQEIRFWTELPLCLGDGSDATMRCDVSKIVGAGMKFRSLEETALDTLEFARSRGEEHRWRNGLPAEKEAKLLSLLDR